jgi:hypothetical protein
MPKIDAYEKKVLGAFEKGRLKSVAGKGVLARLKAAARATSKPESGSTSKRRTSCTE